MELNQIIGQNIKELRKKNNMTQIELGNKIGYSDKTISKWENGDLIPDVITLKNLSNTFNVQMDYFVHLGNDDEKKKFVLDKLKTINKILISALGFTLVWLLILILFIYSLSSGTFLNSKCWVLFIWGVPISCLVLLYFNRLWGKKSFSLIISTIFIWSTLTAFYLHKLMSINSQNFWLIFLLGIPLQIIYLLWYNLR